VILFMLSKFSDKFSIGVLCQENECENLFIQSASDTSKIGNKFEYTVFFFFFYLYIYIYIKT
jgi:hypothetical protein